MSTAFCTTCRTMREVMDDYETDDGDRYAENAGQGSGARTYRARPLECGHAADDGPAAPSRPVECTPGLVERVAALQAQRAR